MHSRFLCGGHCAHAARHESAKNRIFYPKNWILTIKLAVIRVKSMLFCSFSTVEAVPGMLVSNSDTQENDQMVLSAAEVLYIDEFSGYTIEFWLVLEQDSNFQH